MAASLARFVERYDYGRNEFFFADMPMKYDHGNRRSRGWGRGEAWGGE